MMNKPRYGQSMTRVLQSLLVFGFCLYVLGPIPARAATQSTEATLVEANTAFTFKGDPIHPVLINKFQNWLSDYRPPTTVTLDVGAAYETNEYSDPVSTETGGGISAKSADDGSVFSYQHLGRLNNGVHVLLTKDKSTGTGVFQNLTFVRFHLGQGFDRDGIKPSTRLLLSVVRVYGIEGRQTPDIQIGDSIVRIKQGTQSIELRFDE